MWRDGGGWHGEIFANQGGGTPCTIMGAGRAPAAVLDDEGLDVFFKGNNVQLCGASNDSGVSSVDAWRYTTIDGLGAPSGNGALTEVIPFGTTAIDFAGHRYVFYVDTDDPPHIGTHRVRQADLLQPPRAVGRWCEAFGLAPGC
jgi:hypothetical protein